jgi:hypothetical protein
MLQLKNTKGNEVLYYLRLNILPFTNDPITLYNAINHLVNRFQYVLLQTEIKHDLENVLILRFHG